MTNTNKNKTNATTSIINVTVNGMSAIDTVSIVKTRLENVEKSIFNIALLCAYGVGVEIPSYTDNKGVEHGKAICEKPIKQNDYIKLVGRSKQTISRWILAMKSIIENGRFTEFANGEIPFSYDKILIVFKKENKEKFSDYILSDLFKMSCDTLEAMTSVCTEDSEAVEEEATEETTVEEVTENKETSEATEELATFTYNGKEYSVNKEVFEKFLAENATILK